MRTWVRSRVDSRPLGARFGRFPVPRGTRRPESMPVHLKVFGEGGEDLSVEPMTDEDERPGFREHLREMRRAIGEIGKDVEIEVTDAPHLAKEGTKNAIARAAGIRRTPMREWAEPETEGPR